MEFLEHFRFLYDGVLYFFSSHEEIIKEKLVMVPGWKHVVMILIGGLLIYLALVSAVAYTLWGCLLKHNPVSRVTIFGFLTPVFGVVLSALLLSEGGALGWSALGALVLVCAGILLVNRPAGSAAEQ